MVDVNHQEQATAGPGEARSTHSSEGASLQKVTPDSWAMTTIRDLASRYDTFMFDCDGVVWQAETQIGEAFRAIQWLESDGKKVFFVTNTASKLPSDCFAKMQRMGFAEPKLDHIYTMASVAAKFVKRKHPNVRKVLVIGMAPIRKALEAEGIEVIGADHDIIPQNKRISCEEYDNYEVDRDVGAVVFGIDFSFSTNKLLLASLYLQELKVPLVVTNDDATALINGRYMPGTGCCLQAILASCNLKPGQFDIVGKPNPFTVELIRQEHNLDTTSRTVMIGDRPNTDILFGKAAGVDQCLVLSGVVRGLDDFRANWLPKDPEYSPTYMMQMVGDLDATI